jgi:repressor LexA
MSETRRRILEFIRSFMEERGYGPTIRDIMKGLGISTPSLVQHHLRMLEREGHIERDPQVVRGIKLKEREVLDVPLLGTIAAGRPIPVPEPDLVPERTLKIPIELLGNRRNVYALRVMGNSMRDAMIMDGDMVVMEAKQIAENGEMVGVWLRREQEVTLKRIFFEGERVRLQPENEEMEPIFTYPENVEIQGRVLLVIRKV